MPDYPNILDVGAACALVRNSAVQALSTGGTTLTWDTVVYQVGSLWVAGSPTRLTVPATGLWLLTSSIRCESDADGRCQFVVNGSAVHTEQVSGFWTGGAGLTAHAYMTKGQYAEIQATPAGNVNSIVANDHYFSIAKIG